MAKVRQSAQQYTITVASAPADHLTAWGLRDIVRALDDQGIPDEATVLCSHSNSTQALTGVRVYYTVIVAPADGDEETP